MRERIVAVAVVAAAAAAAAVVVVVVVMVGAVDAKGSVVESRRHLLDYYFAPSVLLSQVAEKVIEMMITLPGDGKELDWDLIAGIVPTEKKNCLAIPDASHRLHT